MRIFERDPRQRQLMTIYVPQEPRRVMPSELAEEIVLVHPAQPIASAFHQMRRQNIVGALGVDDAPGPEPAEDRYHWVHVAAVRHDDPVARRLRLKIEEVGTGTITLIHTEPTVPTGLPVALPRSILLAPGFRMVGSADAIAAGQRVTFSLIYLDLLQAETSPNI